MFHENGTNLIYNHSIPEIYHKHTRVCTRGFGAIHVVHFKEFDIWPNCKIVSLVQHSEHVTYDVTKPDVSIQ